jgi:hypothetical protein
MWICFNDAFISAVESETDPTVLKVRARKRKHLKTLFPKKEIYSSEDTDYRFRVFVSRKAFARVLLDRVWDIDYTNFKDSVEDKQLHDLYASFWTLHWKYQQQKELVNKK